jgi:hypothetical protein
LKPIGCNKNDNSNKNETQYPFEHPTQRGTIKCGKLSQSVGFSDFRFAIAIAGVALRFIPAYIVSSRWDGFVDILQIF